MSFAWFLNHFQVSLVLFAQKKCVNSTTAMVMRKSTYTNTKEKYLIFMQWFIFPLSNDNYDLPHFYKLSHICARNSFYISNRLRNSVLRHIQLKSKIPIIELQLYNFKIFPDLTMTIFTNTYPRVRHFDHLVNLFFYIRAYINYIKNFRAIL